MKFSQLASVALCAGVILCAGCRDRSANPDPRLADGPLAPAGRWFLGQRATSDRIPVRARSRALELARAAGLQQATGNWANIGPRNIGGRVTALAQAPLDPTRIWYGAAAGGVFRSDNGGVDWVPVFDDQVALSIGSLAAHPTDPDTLYVGTGEDNGGGMSYDGEGVFKTTDGGENWTNLGLAETRRIGKMAVDPTDGNRIFVAAGGDWFAKDSHRGIYRSLDGGVFWQQVLFVTNDAGGADIAIDPTNPNRIFASIWQRFSFGNEWYIGGAAGGIYRSLDGGDSWIELTNGLPPTPGRIGLAIAPSDTNVVYATIITSAGTLDGIFQTTDGGDSWVKKSSPTLPGQFTSFSYYFSQTRVDPDDSTRVYALDQRLHLSVNSGLSFAAIAPTVHVDWHDLIPGSGGTLIAGTDGGFYTSVDAGVVWAKAADLPITQLYDIAIDSIQPRRRFAGAQDNGTVHTATDVPDQWVPVLGGDGLQCEVDYTDSSKVYASSQFGFLARSVNGGANFVAATTGISQSERKNWNAPYVIDPVVPSTLYTATSRVYRSLDSAQSWSAISPDLTNFASAETDSHEHDDHPGANHLENLIRGTVTVVHPSVANSDVIWAGTDDGNVWVTSDAGSSWNQANPEGPLYWVTDLAADPTDPDRAWLSVTGYRESDKMPYVRMTADRGLTWTDISGNLPQVPVNTLVPDSVWKNRIFAGNDLGVYYTDDGLSWLEMRGAMPHVVVLDLVLHAPTHSLFSGTHARGIYTFDLTQLPAADTDGDGANDPVDCDPADPTAFAQPGEVDAVVVANGAGNETVISWADVGPLTGSGTVYDVATGSLSDLRDSGFTNALPLDCGLDATTALDDGLLAAGSGRYYLVRPLNACGNGTWGRSSLEVPRELLVCPAGDATP